MFDDIIQKEKEYITIYTPYIPLQLTLLKKVGKSIMEEIDEEIVKSVIKEANRS